MTIHLSKDAENAINAAVQSGRFASAAAMIDRLVLEDAQRHPPVAASSSSQGLIGALRDDAELLDQAVEHVMKVREERPWRLTPGE